MKQRYLLAVTVPFLQDSEGNIWLDELWWHDLRAHLTYLENITVLAARYRISTPDRSMTKVTMPENGRLEFVALFPTGGRLRTLMHLPLAIWTTWKCVARSDLVHSGAGGWPVPIGAIVNPITVLRGKPLIIVIESAFWRVQQNSSRLWGARLRAWFTERLARWSLRRATLAIYTHVGYKESLPIGPKGTAVVLPASWISEQDIISSDEAGVAWDKKSEQPRFLLASRLVPEKGVSLFLETLHQLEKMGASITIDIIGSGPMRSDIESFARNAKALHIRLLDPLPYGPPFLQFLRTYHATIVPLTGDEQARILYDSFSQAVPVIATDTAGNRQVVTHGKNGFLFASDKPEAFAETLISCARDPDALRRAGLAALNAAASHTHADMHEKRAVILRKLFGTDPRS